MKPFEKFNPNKNKFKPFYKDEKDGAIPASKNVGHFDKLQSKDWDRFMKNILFDEKEFPAYKKDEYIKGLPSDFGMLNSIDLRVNKMKFDKYYFSPNFHRIASLKICNKEEASLWMLLSNLVIIKKCINFPLIYYASNVERSNTVSLYMERADNRNVLNIISNDDILLQVALAFYFMYKNNIWCQTPIFDIINIPKTNMTFKLNTLGFQVELSRIVVLSKDNVLVNLNLNERTFLNLFLALINQEQNNILNRPYTSFAEFFIFRFYDKLNPSVLQPLKNRTNEIYSSSIIMSYHRPGTFVQFRYFDKVYTGILLERLENGMGTNFNNCIIVYFTDSIDVAFVNETEVYQITSPLISFLGLTIGE